MADLTVRDVFDLPADAPRCLVQIQDFDDERVLQENIRDYVIPHPVWQPFRLLRRRPEAERTSYRRQAAGSIAGICHCRSLSCLHR